MDYVVYLVRLAENNKMLRYSLSDVVANGKDEQGKNTRSLLSYLMTSVSIF